jgi:hypothetical protein
MLFWTFFLLIAVVVAVIIKDEISLQHMTMGQQRQACICLQVSAASSGVCTLATLWLMDRLPELIISQVYFL